MKNLIIEKPSLAPLPGRIGWAFFTTFFWILWIYLWMPLITLFVWWLGFKLFNRYFLSISASELTDFKQLIFFYGIVIVCLAGSLLAWAGSEFLRFRNVNQRTRPAPVEIVELADAVQIPVIKMAELNAARRMIAHHDEHGKFLYAEIG